MQWDPSRDLERGRFLRSLSFLGPALIDRGGCNSADKNLSTLSKYSLQERERARNAPPARPKRHAAQKAKSRHELREIDLNTMQGDTL